MLDACNTSNTNISMHGAVYPEVGEASFTTKAVYTQGSVISLHPVAYVSLVLVCTDAFAPQAKNILTCDAVFAQSILCFAKL